MRPSWCERVTATSGHSACRIAAASSSHDGFSGEKTDVTPTDVSPATRMRRAAARMPVVSKGTMGRPSNSWPPSSITASPRTIAARSSGQSTNGGSEAEAGSPIRIAATGVRSRRWTTALVKWVMPTMTASMDARSTRDSSSSVRSARPIPVVTSGVVGVFTAWTTRASASRTASVLVPPTSIPSLRVILTGAARPAPSVGGPRRGAPRLRSARRDSFHPQAARPGPSVGGPRRGAPRLAARASFRARAEYGAEVEVVAEGARADVLEPLGRQEQRRSREGQDAHTLAVAQRLGADGLAGGAVEHADEVGRHDARLAVEPADGELVLERELEGASPELVEPVERRRAPEEALGRPARDVADLALEEEHPVLGLDDGAARVAVGAPRRLDGLAEPDRLGRRVEDRALLDFLAGAGGLAGGRDRADLDARLARQTLHPLPRRRARHDHGVVANVGEREGVHAQVVDGEARHLRFGERAAHAVGVHDGQVEERRGHEGLDRVPAADLERHDGVETAPQILLHHRDGARDGARIREPLLAHKGRAHVRDHRHEVVVAERHRVHEPADGALAVELAHVEERQVGAAAAAGAEDPGADRERLDLGRGDGAERGHRVRMLSCRRRGAPAGRGRRRPWMTLRRVRMSCLVTVALAALVVAAPVSGFERVGDRTILVFAGRQEVPTIDPSVKYDWSIRMMQQALYDALVKYTGDPPEIVPWLAESWESSPDARTWTFHLVKNARFHTGDPVTAEAVRWSFVRTLRLNAGPAWMLSDFLKEDGVKVLGAHTIQFALTRPYAPFLSFLPWWYVMNPKQVLAHEVGGDLGQKWLTSNEAGSGPFRIKRWEQGVLYEIEAVDGYWKGWPSKDHVGGVILKIVREAAVQRAALLRGEADIVEGLSADDFDQVAKMRGIVVPTHPGMTTFGIKMNTQKAPTRDVNLRKALSYAFDYEALLKIYNGNAILQTSPFPNATRGHIGGRLLPPGSRAGEGTP